MLKLRNKTVPVKATAADRELARRLAPDASLDSIDAMAAARAVARSIVCDSKGTVHALNVLTAEVPKQTLKAWAEQHLKAA